MVLPVVLLLLSATCHARLEAGEKKLIKETVDTAHDKVIQAIEKTETALHSKGPQSTVDVLLKLLSPNRMTMSMAESADTFDLAIKKMEKLISEDSKDQSQLTSKEINTIGKFSGCKKTLRKFPNCAAMECFHAHFRTFDGTCNNKRKPLYGAANTPFRRLTKPQYEDGISEPIGWNIDRLYNGFRKPSTRLISQKFLTSSEDKRSSMLSAANMLWGQFLDHDLDFTPLEPSNRVYDGGQRCNETCSNSPPCFPIKVPLNDSRIKDRRCMGFIRSAGTCTTLRSKKRYIREQINELTSYIDASMVYGSSKKQADDLRDLTNQNGKLRNGPMSRNNKPLLPLDKNASPSCVTDPSQANKPCFIAGDGRVMENIALTTFHILFQREHNRLVTELKSINPHWNGDRLYFEARKIVGAMIQHITYTAWLPTILGHGGMRKLRRKYMGYNSSVSASISNVFATAAFRFGHTRISHLIYRYDENLQEVPEGHLPLYKTAFAPFRINEAGIDAIIRGMVHGALRKTSARQPMSSEVTEKLFKLANKLALDLGALNTQRGRDHGLPGYTQWRSRCYLKPIKNFEGLRWDMPHLDIRRKLEEVYGHVDNIDMFVGGVLEYPLPGAQIGRTFQCILINQFRRLRAGDRFWYEAPGQFTSEQLNEIKKANLARIFCDNGDDIRKMVRDPFRLAKSITDFVNCDKLPQIDLKYWREDPGNRTNFCFEKAK